MNIINYIIFLKAASIKYIQLPRFGNLWRAKSNYTKGDKHGFIQ
jgi:hypothetical protein